MQDSDDEAPTIMELSHDLCEGLNDHALDAYMRDVPKLVYAIMVSLMAVDAWERAEAAYEASEGEE